MQVRIYYTVINLFIYTSIYNKLYYFSEMDDLQHCIVKHLETCEESTPANLVESAFKFIRNETPCKNFTSTVILLLIL